MKRYRGFEFRHGVENFARKAASALSLRDLRICWNPGVSTAGVTQNGVLYLADINDDDVLTHHELLKYCGYVLHELCHLRYTDWDYRGDDDYERTLHNAVEDAFIEHKAINLGLVGNVSEVFHALIDRMVGEALDKVTDWSDPRQYPFVLAVYLRKHAARKIPLANGLQPIFDEAAASLVSASNSGDTLNIAKRVYEQLRKLPKPKDQQGKDSKPEGDQDGAGDADGDADGDAGQPVGDAANPGVDCDPNGVEPTLPQKKNCGYGHSTYSTDQYLTEIEAHQRGSVFDLGSKIPGKLRYNLKRLFDNSDYSDFQNNRKFGTVNTGALASYKHNANVFKLRREVEGINSAVVICLDVSQSMFTDEPDQRRIKLAVQCASALVDTLRFAQVSTAILTFGSRVAVLKNWNDGVSQTKDRLAHIDEGGSTNDYNCIRYAHDLLLHRPENRKVCIVITDGEGWKQAATQQVKSGTNLGITTIGVGISLNVSSVYDQSINVQDVNDLGVETFKNIKLAA